MASLGRAWQRARVKKKRRSLTLEQIKKLTAMAMFSDDDLTDQLVLKGGNAMALIYKLTSRESVDLGFLDASRFFGWARNGRLELLHPVEAA